MQEIQTHRTLLYLACEHLVFEVKTNPKKEWGQTTQKRMVYKG